jgi:DUF4097 and DUF4098 domain-containing protein YvlB
MRTFLRKISFVAVLCAVIGIAGCCIQMGCGVPLAKHTRVVTASAPLAAGGSFAAETHNGSITLTGAEVTDCNVTATITARAGSEDEARRLAEQTRIKLVTSPNKLTAKIDKPRTVMNQSVSVSLEVTVPVQTGAALTTHNGNVRISNLAGLIEATTHNGKVTASGVAGTTKLRTHNGPVTCDQLSGDIKLVSHNGNVRAAYSRSAPSGLDVSMVTHNGRIEFAAPPDYSAAAKISTHNGTISTELPIAVVGKIQRGKLQGIIGNGEGRLHLETHNGSIRIKK